MSNHDRKARRIPDEFLPIAEQALLNMAVGGEVRVIRDGHDITRSLVSQAGRINKDYESSLNAIRSKRSIQTGRMSQMQSSAPVTAKPAAPINHMRHTATPLADAAIAAGLPTSQDHPEVDSEGQKRPATKARPRKTTRRDKIAASESKS